MKKTNFSRVTTCGYGTYNRTVIYSEDAKHVKLSEPGIHRTIELLPVTQSPSMYKTWKKSADWYRSHCVPAFDALEMEVSCNA